MLLFLMCELFSLCFFFFKQKTAYEMRISDWSSDVCSSDLEHRAQIARRDVDAGVEEHDQPHGQADQEGPRHGRAHQTRDQLPGRERRHQVIDDIALDLADQQREAGIGERSEEHTSELQSPMRISYAVSCLKKQPNRIHKKINKTHTPIHLPYY